ncbi:hypothetical protein EYF80_022626 [Liparis tanakae]|uniref:Uncharacterized protein n=1 Tax=Liparis tanakae TaxID=230148 RepID=A0A4Z2HMM4_9TELE|nr:hypothetical protein EYF80_022626 [Liparis tanakae]
MKRHLDLSHRLANAPPERRRVGRALKATRPVSHGDAEAGEESNPTRRRRTDEESRRHFTSLVPFLSPTSDFQPDSIFEKRPVDAGPVSMDDSWGGADNPAGLLFRL